MKKTIILLTMMVVLISGCTEDNKVLESGRSTTEEVIYQEKKMDLGFSKDSTIQLKGNSAGTEVGVQVDDIYVKLEGKENLNYENPKHIKILSEDFDEDGVKELLLLYYGGASGGFLDFYMLTYTNHKWEIMQQDYEKLSNPEYKFEIKGDSVYLKVKMESPLLYEKEFFISEDSRKYKSEVPEMLARCIEVREKEMYLAYRIQLSKDAFSIIGDVRQKILLDKESKKLVLGDIEFVPYEEAKKIEYELVE